MQDEPQTARNNFQIPWTPLGGLPGGLLFNECSKFQYFKPLLELRHRH